MTDPFFKHGISHLSPSSINTYAAEPAYWSWKYLLGHTDTAGAAAWRGSAVEAGLDHWLFKRDKGAAQKAALDRFEFEAMGDLDEKVDKQRILIFPMLDMAMDAIDREDPPTVRQFDIKYWVDGIEVPIVGRIDYEWPELGIDLKTVQRMPRHVPEYHGRQIAVYQAARKKPYQLLYVSEKTAIMRPLPQEEHDRYLKQITWYANKIRSVLATFDDKLELARMYPPKFDSFYWNEESMKSATEIWEL